jgi:protein phosphatase
VRATVRFTCSGRTDVGVVRSGNEDNFLIVPDRALFIVADGMGGHAAGEVASEMAVGIIARELGDVRDLDVVEAQERIRAAIREANAAIFDRTLTEHDKRGMGTTTTTLVLMGLRYLIGQVGDSRAYLLRDGRLVQLTKDHSYVQEQVDAGYLSPEEARVHPYSNVITRCVGANEDVIADTYIGTMHAGDLFLLASDGLTGMIDDPRLHELLQSSNDPQQLSERLIAEANRLGGLDNITVIVVRIDAVEQNGGDRIAESREPIAEGR